jgi:hypothetical protein
VDTAPEEPAITAAHVGQEEKHEAPAKKPETEPAQEPAAEAAGTVTSSD